MIEGFKLRVTSSELKQHCLDRAAYHSKRAADKEQELPALKESYEKITKHNMTPEKAAHMNKSGVSYGFSDPVPELEGDIRNHRNMAVVFTFFAGHLFDEDYNLDESALRRLEIVR